ncbi:helix-turn-helix domain-containing protein [Scytonema sp. UIC 10036]|nr:helix-turn-helix domain-containing protein [Scytonema sp. UIC 10036]
MKGGSKYQPLFEYLHSSDRTEVTLSFAEIEALMGDSLPETARTQRRWWGNRSKGALQASAWMNAGYIVGEIDLEQERITFRKPASGYKVQPVANSTKWNSDSIKALRLKMGLTQSELAEELGVRQQTVSEWENGIYEPTRATSKHLNLVAEKAGFKYKIGE